MRDSAFHKQINIITRNDNIILLYALSWRDFLIIDKMDGPLSVEAKSRLSAQNISQNRNESTNLTHMNKLKNDVNSLIEQLDACTSNPNMTESEWQKAINLRYSIKIKLEFANSRLSELLNNSENEPITVVLQLKRFRAIFDQITSEFNTKSRVLDQQYSRFTLFESNPTKTKILDSGKVVVEAIMDVESLTQQASLNLEILASGNARMNKIYGRLNEMVHGNFVNITKMQKSIHYVLLKNRAITSFVMGICIFIVIYKLILSKIF
ncbi:hypothetical protein BdWA1_001576 [Babesia duncani]|uniref:Uncharacterized protein n=1 Tax=Babesia duncani TaxID=323732 RepID=A0AAD9PL23_9APIC|nr:hypothetical protein BdWA1_001576 [Babesia duncani]